MYKKLFEVFDSDSKHRIQGIFSSIFILQNRMQTAGEKIQTNISMKQWLLLAMIECCPETPTLTNLGNLMGCSRQNVKKLASALEKQGFVLLSQGGSNSLCVKITDKAIAYGKEMEERNSQTLQLLFADFNDNEIKELFRLYSKLYTGIVRVEKYAKELS